MSTVDAHDLDASSALRTVPVEACPLCGGTDSTEIFRGTDQVHETPGNYRFVRCESCGSAYQDPRVADDELHRCYADQYYTHVKEGEAAPDPFPAGRLWQSVRNAVKSTDPGWTGKALASHYFIRERAFGGLPDPTIPRRHPPGRALEVGPGAGDAVILLRQAGWAVEAVEWDPQAADVCRKRTGIDVRVGGFPDVSLPDDAYDLVLLGHVFEHLPRPVEALEAIRRILRDGGRAVLLYPNPDAFGARVWGSDWFCWDLPRHLVLPSHRGLAIAADRTGLDLELRTSSRLARWVFPVSADRRRGIRTTGSLGARGITSWIVEWLLVRAGFAYGEETVATLRKRPSGAWSESSG